MTILVDRIKELRSIAGLSQEEMAALLNMSRLTYRGIELGSREPKRSELKKIADIFETTVEELESEWSDEVPHIPDSKYSKMMHTILYILSKCAWKPNFGKIVLNKLLYFADFNYYEKHFETITGEQYVKMPMWPVPKNIDTVLAGMERNGLIQQMKSTYYGYDQRRFIPLVSPDLWAFNGNEIQEINTVISKYGDKTGKWLTEYSHEDMPWKATKEVGEVIEYGLVHYRSPLYSVVEQYGDD